MQARVTKLHTVLRPYLLRRLKIDVEKELPLKYEHVVMCRLSKRQRFLYDEFMQRAQTREALTSGVYHKVANILMQLRKVCNHPDLFEVRPIVTSFAMEKSAITDFEIEEFLIRRRMAESYDEFGHLSLPTMKQLGMVFTHDLSTSYHALQSTHYLDETDLLPVAEMLAEVPPVDMKSLHGFRKRRAYCLHLELIAKQNQRKYINGIRCRRTPSMGLEFLKTVRSIHKPLLPLSAIDFRTVNHLEQSTIVPKTIVDFASRSAQLDPIVAQFAFVTPAVVAKDLTRLALPGAEEVIMQHSSSHPTFDAPLHHAAVRLQIAFPDSMLLEYDCGKLQELARLLRERRAGGHRVLIFTQMTRILDILEIFLNIHGWLYLRLDGATKIEDRQYVTERFNADTRVFAFIASSRSGGVGVK
jgi:helicase SWR1